MAAEELQQFRQLLLAKPDEQKFEVCKEMRDHLLDSYTETKSRCEMNIADFETAMRDLCPTYVQYKTLWDKPSVTGDQVTPVETKRWMEFVCVATSGHVTKKQRDEQLEKVCVAWGPEKSAHYGWKDRSNHALLHLSKAAGQNTWEEVVVKLNQVIRPRAIKGRTKDSTDPIEAADWKTVRDWLGRGDHTKTTKGGDVRYSYRPLASSEIPTRHSLDLYGVLVREEFGCRLPADEVADGVDHDGQNDAQVDDNAEDEPEGEVNLTDQNANKINTQQDAEPKDVPDPNSVSKPRNTNKTTSFPIDVTKSAVQPVRKSLRARAARSKPLETPGHSIVIRKSTRKPPTSRGRCSCPHRAPPALLHAIERTSYEAEDEGMLERYWKHQHLLCQYHITRYASWASNVAMNIRRYAPLVAAGQLTASHTHQLPKRRHSISEFEPLDSKRRATARLLESPSGFHALTETCNSFRDQVLRELEDRKPPRNTWDEINTKSMLRLLKQATPPRVTGNQGQMEAYFLSGSEAEEYVSSEMQLYGPIITEHQQKFQWKDGSRPCKQLFDHMWDMDRVVSVQDPSRKTTKPSSIHMTLNEIRSQFLESTESQRLNVLELRNPIAHTCPDFLTGEDCQLLHRIHNAVLDSHTAERISATQKQWLTWKDDREWMLLAQGGASTLTHRDSCGKGTWLTVQEGLVGFGWLSRPSEDELQEWKKDPTHFCSGQMRYVVLRPGQTIYFEAGTIHFVFRAHNIQTLMFGGHILRWSRIPQWLGLLNEQLEDPDTSNEDLTLETAQMYISTVAKLVQSRAGTLADTFQRVSKQFK